MVTLWLSVDVDGHTMELLLCRAAVHDPDLMEAKLTSVEKVKKAIKAEIARCGVQNLDGWCDHIIGREAMRIENWAHDLLIKFGLRYV